MIRQLSISLVVVGIGSLDISMSAAAMPCDGEWKIQLERRIGAGRREDYIGKIKVDAGKYTMSAQAGIYQMVSEGTVSTECSISRGLLRFQNQPQTYYLDVSLTGNPAKGEWYGTSGARWRVEVTR